ncbi:hypothetical protein [uncultured Pseudomonas sp.]|uniref:hypothetical protein n=1 Tax=uncultured Pseudomonas sp. TaxID=114707 RepID=UPI0025828A2F|nr:hypothetical protein [uncultured Pseudomonas sp.]
MSDHGDELKLRLNVKFKSGTSPALLAELSSLPERRRVKRLLDLAQTGLLYEQTMGSLPLMGVTETPVDKADEAPSAKRETPRHLDSEVDVAPTHQEGLQGRGASRPSPGKREEVPLGGAAGQHSAPARKRPGFNTTMTG